MNIHSYEQQTLEKKYIKGSHLSLALLMRNQQAEASRDHCSFNFTLPCLRTNKESKLAKVTTSNIFLRAVHFQKVAVFFPGPSQLFLVLFHPFSSLRATLIFKTDQAISPPWHGNWQTHAPSLTAGLKHVVMASPLLSDLIVGSGFEACHLFLLTTSFKTSLKRLQGFRTLYDVKGHEPLQHSQQSFDQLEG